MLFRSWSFEEIIEYLSRSETLHPGEFLGSGTCSGAEGRGCGLEQGRSLAPGDLVELEVERIGLLRNRVVAGEFHLTTSQLGPNFYIGNHPGADGSYRPLSFGRGDALREREDATRLAGEFAPHFDAALLQSLPDHRAVVRTLVRGLPATPQAFSTVPWIIPPASINALARIRQSAVRCARCLSASF